MKDSRFDLSFDQFIRKVVDIKNTRIWLSRHFEMAFVSRSERKFELDLQAKKRMGPGEYLKHNRSESKKSHVPFDSSTSRTMLLDSDRSKSPGPGNYSFSDIQSS